MKNNRTSKLGPIIFIYSTEPDVDGMQCLRSYGNSRIGKFTAMLLLGILETENYVYGQAIRKDTEIK